jgi:hypothetical protein
MSDGSTAEGTAILFVVLDHLREWQIRSTMANGVLGEFVRQDQ